MQPGSAPIGFEGIISKPTSTFIGFEQYEVEQEEKPMPVYPPGKSQKYDS